MLCNKVNLYLCVFASNEWICDNLKILRALHVLLNKFSSKCIQFRSMQMITLFRPEYLPQRQSIKY